MRCVECEIVFLAAILCDPAEASGQTIRELKVHLVQANNDSHYAFVRAKFEPGELSQPWAVRFFDERGAEIPYFVWGWIDWETARVGRADWGHRYAAINHAPGHMPEVLEARGRKLQWARPSLPELGRKLAAEEEAAGRAGSSVCAAMYLLRRHVPAFEKQRLTIRIYPKAQFAPKHQQWNRATAVHQGQLSFDNMPDHLAVSWKGKDLFHYAGFEAGGSAGDFSHADPSRPLSIEY